ncbi:DUF7007 domain-containing protein [Undibacterium oligocarboniphilum]|uniref:DUF7007 domain-containing protein n=1 Tax=Undibacterium oligocarboniphilum TaxID=666702 RepID=A0A850QIH3_9BURK|nr:hypothetical protein [Undibacterium oligocarboniphilum]MBC3871735.1 hypothetical protein [Undibacterium oligocarboniphilum]NVO79371.1 hypothetical protein [Undibacterium oligocarboniphilum]
MATSTPWGVAQNVTNIARGIRSVTTAGHGGVLVSPTKNNLIPEYMRHHAGEYEEDCEWCIPAIVFESEWRLWADKTNWTSGDFQMECAWNTFKNWFPESYEKFTGKQLQIGESYNYNERILKLQVREQFVTCAAWGDWQAGVPEGMVGLLARRAADGQEIFSLVPKAEYSDRKNVVVGKAGVFVIDPAKHQIIPIPEYAK